MPHGLWPNDRKFNHFSDENRGNEISISTKTFMGACLANSTEFNVSLYIFHSQAPDVIIVSGFYFCNKYVPT